MTKQAETTINATFELNGAQYAVKFTPELAPLNIVKWIETDFERVLSELKLLLATLSKEQLKVWNAGSRWCDVRIID
jgi:hypothetical protein